MVEISKIEEGSFVRSYVGAIANWVDQINIVKIFNTGYHMPDLPRLACKCRQVFARTNGDRTYCGVEILPKCNTRSYDTTQIENSPKDSNESTLLAFSRV